MYKIKKQDGKLIIDKDAKAFTEINGYKGLDAEGNYKGYIDLDSKPGNMNLNGTDDGMSTYEDDEDRAPIFKQELEKSIFGDDEENSGKILTPDADGNIGNIKIRPNGTIYNSKDSSANYENYYGYRGNAIEGNVWEDLRKDVDSKFTLLYSNGQVVSDGLRQKDEPLLNDVKAEVIEVFKSPHRPTEILEKSLEKMGGSMRTKKAISLVTAKKEGANYKAEDGGYGFYNLSSGTYKIRMTYGDTEHLTKQYEKNGNLKYNGQDYQSVDTEKRRKLAGDNSAGGSTTTAEDYSNVEIMVNLDTSNSMKDLPLEKIKKISKRLVERLNQELPLIKIGLSEFSTEAIVKQEVMSNPILETKINSLLPRTDTYLGRGMVGNSIKGGANARFSNNNDILERIMIILTDSYPEGYSGDPEVILKEATVDTAIRGLEKISDEEDIYPIAVVTSNYTEVFGTSENPRRGDVFYLGETNIDALVDQIVNKIIELIKSKEVQAHKTGTIYDVVKYLSNGRVNYTIPGTRPYVNTQWYGKMMNNTSATGINPEEIAKITDSTARNKAIYNFGGPSDPRTPANPSEYETYMTAESKDILIKSNTKNEAVANINERNLALELRPETKLTIETEINSIQITLSNGDVLIDTEKGLSKNVNGLDKIEKDPTFPVSVYMDEEIMQGATLKVKYKLKITNVGEIDRVSNYYGDDNKTITTSAGAINSYLNKNFTFLSSDMDNQIWNVVEATQMQSGTVDQSVMSALTNNNIVTLQTMSLQKALYPVGSPEAEAGGSTSVSGYLTFSRTIYPQENEVGDGGFLEINNVINSLGKRMTSGLQGNLNPVTGANLDEYDSTKTAKVIITKPLGENKSVNYAQMVLIVSTIALILSILIIIDRKKRKK